MAVSEGCKRLSRTTSARAYLGLGGNIGNPRAAMAEALQTIDATPGVTVMAVSSIYRTPPWGKLDQPDFLNVVAEIETTLKPRQLLDSCLDAERKLKRVRTERWGPRLIDIDVLWFDGKTVDEPGLQVPHPRMMERAFVMVPLAEIARDLILQGHAAVDIAAELDRSGVERITKDGSWWRATP